MRALLRSLLILLSLSLFAQAQGYAVGDRVIFDYYQTPTEGEILAKQGNQYLIRFKTAYGDSQAYYDASVVLRRAGEAAPAANNPAAAAGDAGVGQKVLFNYHGEWKEGEVIGKSGNQTLIRHQTAFGPAQAYYQPEDIKPLGVGNPKPGATAQPAPATANANPPAKQPAANPGGAGGLMTEAEVLGFLKARLGANPWAPDRAQVLAELTQQLKSRGMAYHYSSENATYQEISKFGMGSDLTAGLDDNYGPPPQRESLLGTWNTEVNAPPVYFEKDKELWRHNPKVERAGGSLTIDGGGTYSWKLATGAVVKGTWRAATEAEMKTAGGEGLVLSAGRGGWDWIVTKWREPGPPNMSQNWICIAEITTRQEREFGNR